MMIIPAIDLKDGHCVRLEQGRMESATVFSKEPGKAAAQWAGKGARRLHVVDLNGAIAGKPRNEKAVGHHRGARFRHPGAARRRNP